jgi:hypothetical protein
LRYHRAIYITDNKVMAGPKKTKTKSNTGTRSKSVNTSPAFKAANNRSAQRGVSGTVTVSNTEFVADVTAPAVGTGTPVLSYDVNPAGTLFSWLSKVATGYEKFRFKKLEFIYTPTCSSTTSGVVAMAVDFDASDNPPTTKLALSAYGNCVRTNVWTRGRLGVVCPSTWYYVGLAGTTVNPVGTDVKFYDLGKFYLGVFNQSSSTPVGELTVNYTIELTQPDYASPAGYAEYVGFQGTNSLANLIGGGVTTSGNCPVTVTQPAYGVLAVTFPVGGQYCVGAIVASASTSAVANALGNIQQNDPGATTTQVVSASDAVTTGWSSSSTLQTTMAQYILQAAAGTQILIPFVAAVTSGYFQKLRFTTYLKSLP